MTNLRFLALENLNKTVTGRFLMPQKRIGEYFGELVFSVETMRNYVSPEVISLLQNLDSNATISFQVAEEIASAMKQWALSKGATHYTHWFQPLTGLTAEKHDAFFTIQNTYVIESFSGSELAQQEPDASSFPSGGIRNTFEARGYTAWDPSSPAFIIGTTLCIPTIFISHTGEALDFKTPLLKTIALIDKAATDICQLFDKNVTRVGVSLGAEQEYFLVDINLYNARPDLIHTGRTLFGAKPPRGQQLEDHYFGVISERVLNFMMELEVKCHQLGIPLKTRHNEVAPGQFECAPIFEELNIANDHNLLLMDVMQRIAQKHNFAVLLHEKPFSGVNGSGKHNNWSLITNTGKNLLTPGKTAKDNLQFLTFFICTLKALHTHADLMRAGIASASNDHRLGANEAPPAIISAFIGSQLTQILDEFEKRSHDTLIASKSTIKLGVPRIPELLKDNTDRNRTSPFAFTGNKFELRAVGSSANCAPAMIILNTIVADQLQAFKETVQNQIESGKTKETAIIDTLVQYVQESKSIRFEGNGYSEEWKNEAQKRGLSNIPNAPEALKAYISPQTISLFERKNILTERELHARWEIKLETYTKKIQIEARILGEIAINQIVPTAITYQNELITNLKGLREINIDEDLLDAQIVTIKKVAEHVSAITRTVKKMIEIRKVANKEEVLETKSVIYCNQVLPLLDEIRYHCDKLEFMIPDNLWPLPKYRELLFLR
ncbi:MAG: glutamine synthetase III [Bacteroidia bacterium]|nr:glutamine synthetase III [Bacteroidia bacterium]